MQLSQELQFIGSKLETLNRVCHDLPGFDAALETIKAEMAAAEKSEPAAGESKDLKITNVEEPVEDIKGISYGDEDEKRMDVIGQNGNTGEHYAQEFAKQIQDSHGGDDK